MWLAENDSRGGKEESGISKKFKFLEIQSVLIGAQKIRVGFLVLLVGVITFYHYFMGVSPLNHQAYGKLYYGPVILAAFWFGVRGGIWSSLGVDFLLVPHLFFFKPAQPDYLWLLLLEIPPLNLAGLIVGYLRDRERRTARALNQAEPLISLGENSSSVAHEMKNASMSIHGFTRLLKKRGNLPGDLSRFVEVIEGESERMERLAKGMLDFCRRRTVRREKLNPGNLLQDLLPILQEGAREKEIGFQWEIQKDLPPLWLDADRMKEVFINLVQNAIHATPPKGRIILKALRNDGKIKIEISDTGEGIPAKNISQVFRPFFTTKSEGTGLGLPISKRTLEEHGATIEVHSREGKGTQFTILFPSP